VDGKIILEWILGKSLERYGLNAYGSGWGQVAGSCEAGNEPSGSNKRHGIYIKKFKICVLQLQILFSSSVINILTH